jgi:RNA polymerase sigma-70 factor (ECF subfamily)
MMDSATLARLVEEARDASASLHDRHRAFDELVRQSQRLVLGMALASLRHVEDAKDAAQEAFATAWHRLPQLRDPHAFIPWLKAIVATACTRQRRKRPAAQRDVTLQSTVEPPDGTMDYQPLLATALKRLPKGEQEVTMRYYFLGYTQTQIAKHLRLKPGTVAKRLHSARLRIRRDLPRSVRSDFVRLASSKQFFKRVSLGLLDEYVGQYRFDSRPEHVVTITREGDSLVSEANGQRHVLVCVGKQSLLAVHFDGEGRFRRNRRGAVTDFVYYEFGKRMGIARRTNAIPLVPR